MPQEETKSEIKINDEDSLNEELKSVTIRKSIEGNISDPRSN